MTSARVSEPYAFRPTATDADGDRLTFSIQRKPAWATFDTTDGTLYGTPAATDVGTASNVVIGVSDGQATATLPAFSSQRVAAADSLRQFVLAGADQ